MRQAGSAVIVFPRRNLEGQSVIRLQFEANVEFTDCSPGERNPLEAGAAAGGDTFLHVKDFDSNLACDSWKSALPESGYCSLVWNLWSLANKLIVVTDALHHTHTHTHFPTSEL